MKKLLGLALSLAAASAPVHAGTYSIGYASTCPLMQPRELFQLIDRIGIAQNLDLPDGYRIAGDLRCFHHRGISQAQSPAYPYTYRVTIEKQIVDAGQKRWVVLDERTSFGVTDGTNPWMEELRETTRKVAKSVR